MDREPQNLSDQVRFRVWQVFEEIWQTGSREERLEYLTSLSLSQQAIRQLWDEFLQGKTALTQSSGAFTRLPALREDEKKELLAPGGLPGFVQEYVGWVVWDYGNQKERGLSEEEILKMWIQKGNADLGNSEDETRQLLKWMQENPIAVADYLDAVWGQARGFTLPFREKIKLNEIPKLDL